MSKYGARRRSVIPSCLTTSELPFSYGEETENQPRNTKDADDLLQLLGDPGRFQVIQFALLCSQFIPLAMSDLMPIFYGLDPESVSFGRNVTVRGNGSAVDSLDNVPDCNRTHNLVNRGDTCPLHLFKSADMCRLHGFDPDRTEFEFVYKYDGQYSTVGQMRLICGRTWMVGFATTVYYLGQIVASPGSGWLADTYGRRPVLLVSNALYTGLSIGLIFSSDYTSFTILRFLIGMARQAMNTSFYVLMMEGIPPQRRITWAAIAQFPFSAGVLILGLSAYLLQDWRQIQIVLALSNCSAIGLIWFAPESLKWLLFQNRAAVAQSVYLRIAKFNGITVAPGTLDDLKDLAGRLSAQKTATKSYSLLDCFRTFHIRNYTLLCCFIWFAILVQYFGMMLLLSGQVGNIYGNYAISAALELIPRVLGILLTYKLDNRTTMMSYFLVGGILALIAGVVPHSPNHVDATMRTVHTVLTFMARMSVVGCFALAYNFTSELFPTAIRNSGFGLCSIAMRIGSMTAPQIIGLETITAFRGLPFVVTGSITILAALATALLPETKGLKMMSTVEEAEQLGDSSSWMGRLRRWSFMQSIFSQRRLSKSGSKVAIVEETFSLGNLRDKNQV